MACSSRPLIRTVLTLLLLSSTASAKDGNFVPTAQVPPEYAAGVESITESDSEQILRHLVEGDMAGRGTGQEGFLKAAKWFSTQLEASGFQPAGENGSWFQNVPFIKLLVHADASSIKIEDVECVAGTSFGISSFAGNFEGSTPVTFAKLTSAPPEISDGEYAGKLLVIQSTRRFNVEAPFVLKAKPACLLIVAGAVLAAKDILRRQT